MLTSYIYLTHKAIGWIRKMFRLRKGTLAVINRGETGVIRRFGIQGDWTGCDGPGCMGAGEGDIVRDRMTADFSSFVFTFRYWPTIAASAD
jgi:hypothetical protein